MTLSSYSLLIIFFCGLVTWLPRVIPFMLIRKLQLPDIVIRFLSYVPICILTALCVQSLLIAHENAFPHLHMEYIFASLITILVAVFTRNLMWVVLLGMIVMSLIRLFL